MTNSKRVLSAVLLLWLMAAMAAVAQVERAELGIDGLT